MIAEASLSYQDDRKEVFKTENNYEVKPVKKAESWKKKQRQSYDSLPTLAANKEFPNEDEILDWYKHFVSDITSLTHPSLHFGEIPLQRGIGE